MKSLAYASAIVAAASLLCFALLSLVLRLPEQIAGYLSSVLIGALPMLHQEMEKRTSGDAQLIASPVSFSQPPITPSTSQPPQTTHFSEASHIYGPYNMSPGIEAVGSPPHHVATAGVGDQPMPVYVPFEAAAPSAFQAGVPVPVYALPAGVGAAGAMETSYRPRSMTTSWPVMLVYGTVLVVAMRQLGGVLTLLFALAIHGNMVTLEIASYIVLLFIDTVAIFFIGRWVGLRCSMNGIQVAIGMTALGILAAFMLDFIFAPEAAASLGAGAYVLGFFIQMIVLCPCAIFGWWLGNRTRIARAG